MRKIGFVVDSTTGLVKSDASVVNLSLSIDGKEYIDGEVEPSLITNALEKKQTIKTSQPSPNKFLEGYKEQFAKGYEHVICLTISGALSGTINSANLAKDMHESDNITVIDSETAHVGVQYILEKAIEKADSGASASEVVDYINKIINSGSLLFTVDNLSTLVKSGRLSRVQALIGNILRIKPILRFKNSVLEVEHKARGFNGVLKYIEKQASEILHYSKVIIRITYADNKQYAEKIKNRILSLKSDKIQVETRGILNPILSAHIGLGGTGIYLGFEK